MSIKVITAPDSELITVVEAAEFMRIDSYSSETTTISALITAARQWCEEYLGRAIGIQTLEVILDSFPLRGIVLRSPVISVTSVKYLDTSNVQQTLVEDTDYYIAEDSEPGLIKPVSAWPNTLNIADAIRVRYQAGYQAAGDSPLLSAELPSTIKTAMLMLISDMYENREAQVEKVLNANPTVERLLSMYRLEMGI